MADVFLSYARADRDVAERLANSIGRSGRTVWWDRHIRGGSEFARDIEQQLAAATHILVLWSKEAVGSRWVKDEASEAAETGRLIAATIDGTPPPLGFRQFHTIDLSGWTRKGADLPAELAEALGAAGPDRHPAAAPAKPRRPAALLLGMALALVGALALLVAVATPLGESFFAGESRKSVSLAVLPFAAPAGEQAYLGSGVAGALANSLSQLQGLAITSNTSARALAGEGLAASEIGKKLGVTHFVEGDIRPAGDQLELIVRLIDARTSRQLWSGSYEGPASDLGVLQDRVSGEVAAFLRTRLGVGQGRIADRSNVDPRAYEAYLKGLERLSVRHEEESRKQAYQQFQLAASIQPDFADAHAGAAYILALSVPPQMSMEWEELKAEQRRANARALKLDPDNLLALVARANAAHNFDGDIEAAFRDSRRVLAMAPDYGPAHYALASTYALAGDPRSSLPHYDRALASDPFNKTVRVWRQISRYLLRDYEGVRAEALDCEGECEGFHDVWLNALMAFGKAADLDSDLDAIMSGYGNLPEELEKDIRIAAEGMVRGHEFRLAKPRPDDRGFPHAGALAAAGQADDAFRVARYTAPRSQADEILILLADGRLDFPPEMRADPRYHALFRDFPHLRRVAEARRRNGNPAGLPVDPARLAEEKRRLAELRR